ncbi:MAG: type II secretion system protein N [Syntrophales bacterium]
MDWAHYFRFSFSDIQGFFSRRTIILTLMAVLLYQTVGVFYQALTLQLLRMAPPPALEIQTPAVVAALREPLDAYRTISERNIFGTTEKTIEEKQAENRPAPQQDIALLFDLRGTVAGDAKRGFAVIEEKSSHKQRLVKIGDVISGARVLRIKRNALDVLVNDQERTLKMTDKTEAPVLPAAGGQPLPAAPAAAAAPGGTTVVNRTEISAALADMGTLLRQAQVRPYFKGGAADGFMITNIQPGSMYQRLGIVNGDILKGVDGNRIQTADDMISFLNTLKGASGATLTLERGGKPQTLSYQFR